MNFMDVARVLSTLLYWFVIIEVAVKNSDLENLQ